MHFRASKAALLDTLEVLSDRRLSFFFGGDPQRLADAVVLSVVPQPCQDCVTYETHVRFVGFGRFPEKHGHAVEETKAVAWCMDCDHYLLFT